MRWELKMMKKRKFGFTLVELLAVIFIIGIIAVISIPTITRVTKQAREELYQAQISNIYKGTKDWATQNVNILPEEEGETITLTLGQLKIGGFVDDDIKDPRTAKLFPNDMEIVIRRELNEYEYEIIEGSGGENDELDRNSPTIILNGSTHEVVEIHTTYVDKGVIARDPSGAAIDVIDVKITSNNVLVPNIDTTKLIQYRITYSVNYNGTVAKAIRTVTVKDTKPPILNVPGSVVLYDEEMEDFDFMAGVTASDNSEEQINVKMRGNLSSLPGNYLITYIAEDSSGNKTQKNRRVTVLSSS